MGGSVVTLCSLSVAYCLPGTCLGCVLVKGRNADDILTVRTYKTRPLVVKPGNSSCPLRQKKKKKNRAPATRSTLHELRPGLDQCVRTDFQCRGTPDVAFCRKVLVRRGKLKKNTNITIHTRINLHTINRVRMKYTSGPALALRPSRFGQRAPYKPLQTGRSRQRLPRRALQEPPGSTPSPARCDLCLVLMFRTTGVRGLRVHVRGA